MMLISSNKQNRLLALQALVSTTLAAHPGWIFRPQTSGIASGGLNNYPIPYNLSTSQTNHDPASTGSSFWSSSLIHGSNGRDYLVVSHAIAGAGGTSVNIYRASLLDLDDTSQYSQYARIAESAETYGSTGILNFTTSDYAFRATSETDALSSIRTYSQVAGLEYDLTFDLSSPPLLNAGTGTFRVAGRSGFQWSMPAGKTRGWLSVNGTKVDIDTDRSLTWYDRQWGALPNNFTWWQVHIPGQRSDGTEDDLYSIWAWHDVVNGDKAFATRRTGEQAEQSVVPVDWKVSSNRTFTSAATGIVYPLDWTIAVPGGPELELSSIRPDQEMQGAGIPLLSYTGLLDVVATYPGGRKVPAFAVIEKI
ncbi:short-chain dehydrogenase [Trichoderma arundinaceum]|uniref:Short-chain dehydrogenase n=1 Tax=Trichoderma arundinaceum TaxID=490622 RepID=A0A395NU09_TRIAR|nr:short-chain dehydrogenase [Trichoderma arundinaceum]